MKIPEERYRITNLGRGVDAVRTHAIQRMDPPQLAGLLAQLTSKQREALNNGSPSITLRTLASIADASGTQLVIKFENKPKGKDR